MRRDPKKEFYKGSRRVLDPGAEKGAALLMVLILTAISFAFTSGLIYMVTSAVQMSGGQRKFETALDAGKGGTEVTLQVIEARGDPGIPLTNFSLPAETVPGMDCLAWKLNNATFQPDGVTDNWPACDSTLTIDPAIPTSYDMVFDLAAYRVYGKIVDTVDGNSGPSSGLMKTGVVLVNPGEITVVNVPYLYTMELLSQSALNPRERARVSALHLY